MHTDPLTKSYPHKVEVLVRPSPPFLLLTVIFIQCTADAQMTWFDAQGPVLQSIPLTAYHYVYAPSVRFDSSTQQYQMWFMSRSNQQDGFDISHAVSTDGMTWLMYSNNPILKKGNLGTFEERYVGYQHVIHIAEGYRMYYSGFSLSGPIQIGLATSADGAHWVKHLGNPVLSDSNASISSPRVYYDGMSYKMFYNTNLDVALATSTDGIHWTPYSGNPVLARGTAGAWDHDRVNIDALVVVYDLLYLFYGAGQTPIGFATSRDGVNWRKYSGNPVFSPPSTWASRIEYGTMVFKNDLFQYWFSGYDGLRWNIGYAISPYAGPLSAPESDNSGTFEQYRLLECYPNPFNPSTTIQYELPRASMVRLSVYDVLGREVALLVNERKDAGSYDVKLDAAGLASGIYLYRLTAGTFVQTRKMIVAK